MIDWMSEWMNECTYCVPGVVTMRRRLWGLDIVSDHKESSRTTQSSSHPNMEDTFLIKQARQYWIFCQLQQFYLHMMAQKPPIVRVFDSLPKLPISLLAELLSTRVTLVTHHRDRQTRNFFQHGDFLQDVTSCHVTVGNIQPERESPRW